MNAMERVERVRRGFTMLELMVALGILMILTGILVPYIARIRERERRILCSANLSKLGIALNNYGHDNRDELPRVIYDGKNRPIGYTAFTGPDVVDPFAHEPSTRTATAPASHEVVMPNDVTASLWLLIRGGYITSEYAPVSSVFICPSSGDIPDPITDRNGNPVSSNRRSNFRSWKNLSYSYASPFSDASGYGLKSNFISSRFVLLADRNPGKLSPSQDVTAPAESDPPLKLQVANSRNHQQAGQNVLFGDWHVEFCTTPYCGESKDNIYTAAAAAPVNAMEPPTPAVRGVIGEQYGPAWQADTYLVPTESDPR